MAGMKIVPVAQRVAGEVVDEQIKPLLEALNRDVLDLRDTAASLEAAVADLQRRLPRGDNP